MSASTSPAPPNAAPSSALGGSVMQATPRDAAALQALRLASYSRAREFELLLPESLAWNAADDAAVVYKLCDRNGTLLATIRSHWVTEADQLACAMGCDCTLPADCFPTLFLSRGATAAGAASGGLHSLLRLHILRAALRLDAASATGAVYESAPRVRTMAELGYDFSRPAHVWDPEVRAIRPMLVALLPGWRLAAAVQSLERDFGALEQCFPIGFDPAAAQAAVAQRPLGTLGTSA